MGSVDGAVKVTVADAFPEPPVPEHVNVYVVVAVGVTDVDPLVASVPLHPPLAVQAVAFLLDQLNVELVPSVILVGFAVSVTVGAGTVTVTVADPCAEPPEPAHVSVYVVVAFGVTVANPPVASVPLHPPLAVQEVAFVLDQLKVEPLPKITVVGLAVNVTVGAGAFKVTVVDAFPVAPFPLQVNVYVVVAAGVTVTDPLVASEPLQPPDAVQAVAFVLDHVNVEPAPAATLVGFAVNVTVTAGINPTLSIYQRLLDSAA